MSFDNKAFSENLTRIHPGDGTEYVQVSEDSDGLGMVEISLHNPDGTSVASIRVGANVALLVADAIKMQAQALKEKE